MRGFMAVAVLSACSFAAPIPEPDAECPRTVVGAPALAVSLLVDQTGSMRPAVPEEADLSDAAALVRLLPSSTRVSLRWITDRSYVDANRAYSGQIPSIAILPTRPANPFDPEARRAYQDSLDRHERSVRCADAARESMAVAIEALDGPVEPAQRTDVYGALARVSEELEALGQIPRWVVISSDAEDTAGYDVPALPGLDGARVVVRTVRVTADGAEARRVEEAFRALMEEHGATVTFVASDVPWAAAPQWPWHSLEPSTDRR